MCVLLVRPLHPSASSGGTTPSTGTPNLQISAEVSNCQAVEETDLPAVPVGLSSRFTICDCGHVNSSSSASPPQSSRRPRLLGQSQLSSVRVASVRPRLTPHISHAIHQGKCLGKRLCVGAGVVLDLPPAIEHEHPPGSQIRTCPKTASMETNVKLSSSQPINAAHLLLDECNLRLLLHHFASS